MAVVEAPVSGRSETSGAPGVPGVPGTPVEVVGIEAVPFGALAPALAATLPPGQVALYWLGGAGIALQAGRRVIFVDAYLSDLCERRHGFRRLTPSPLRLDEVAPDAWLATHHHADHLDVDAIAALPGQASLTREERVAFAAPPSCVAPLAEAGVPATQIVPLLPGARQRVGPAWVTPTPADHGALAPDAVGVVLELDGLRLYHAGDTCYREDFLPIVRALHPGVAVLPINGKYGNLTPEEAASVAGALGVPAAMPCHYWLLAEHGGDPGAFAACGLRTPAVQPLLVPLGGRCLLRVAAPAGTSAGVAR